jgi:predicted 3-demethylubiquinone-9 3-methyltransferase (glyoxalase superfamily)
MTTTITPFLWFNDNAEEAARYYVAIFENSKLGDISRYGKEGYEIHGRPEGSVMTIEFEIDGHPFVALNGGPHFTFNEAVSFQIDCQSQKEVDYYWNKLTADGGTEQPCGWVKDKYGVSWQVNPVVLSKLLKDEDKGKAGRVMNAMLKMTKPDIAALERAAAGKAAA